MPYKGVVKGNTIILEEGAQLPNGAVVWVSLAPAHLEKEEAVSEEELKERQAVIERMEQFSQKLAGRNVNLGDLILEEREELENRA
jgi:hypothetical protein